MAETQRYRVGFLLLRDIHHVYHLAATAFQLSLASDTRVTLYTSYRRVYELLQQLAPLYPGQACRVELLSAPVAHYLTPRRRPYPRPKGVLRKHRRRLLGEHLIVSCDYYSGHLMRYRTSAPPWFVKTPHGAGSRAYAFKDSLADYDLLLLPGEQFRRELDRRGILARTRWEVVGYPKLDLVERLQHAPRPPLFPRRRPVVLYAPHFDRRLSSWFQWGEKVLRWFYAQPQYNLIFAPHLDLCPHLEDSATLRDCAGAEHIHIDLGSLAASDMSHTRAADIWLGDVSSQVYEFLTRPGPCIFLNPHGLDWHTDPNCLAWSLGRVVDRLPELESALRAAVDDPGACAARQSEQLADIISTTGQPAAARAAAAIHAFVQARMPA